jgi:hypothetical protein
MNFDLVFDIRFKTNRRCVDLDRGNSDTKNRGMNHTNGAVDLDTIHFGIHSYRIFGFAIVDIVGTFFLAVLAKYIFRLSTWQMWYAFGGLMLASIPIHFIAGVDTRLVLLIKDLANHSRTAIFF